MEQNAPTSSAPSVIDDLYTLTLVDGLPVETGGKTIRYRIVKMRETGVADERMAQRAAERVVLVGGVHKLLVSEADFRFALTARHIEAFVCDGQTIPKAVIDLELLGKLSTHDFGLIEQRVFLITLAAEVRYGNMSEKDFDLFAAGKAPVSADISPQPMGQAAGLGANVAPPESGPAMLADFTGDAATGTTAGHAD